MTKILIAVVILAGLGLAARMLRPEPLPSVVLSANDLVPYFEALRNSKDDYAFIIITVVGSEDFLQFQDSGRGLFTDFPLVTERQRTLESTARESLSALGFVIDEQLSKINGSVNARANLGPGEAARAVRLLVQGIFGAPSDAQVKVEWSGIDPSAA